MRNVAVLSGKRGGFGAMKQLLSAIQADNRMNLQLILTDQHLDPKFGETYREVVAHFPVAALVPLHQIDGSPAERAKALGRCTLEMVDVLRGLDPEILVLYGDRGEVLATALSATTLQIPIAHIQGGDISGSLDEVMRHAVTKLSHLHFPSNAESANRIIAMGEEPWRVTTVGDSHLDCISSGEFAHEAEVRTSLGLQSDSQVAVVLQHPDSSRPGDSYQEMVNTLTAALEAPWELVVIYPCSDPGYDGIVRAIDEIRGNPRVRIFRNLDAPLFWGLQAFASALIGNSSAGIVEAPSFRLPVVNVGLRQQGRLRSSNVVESDSKLSSLRAAISRVQELEFRELVKTCALIYGDGQSGNRIHQTLANLPDRKMLLSKRMTY